MTDQQQQHPVIPPPELVQQWLEKLLGGPVSYHSPSDQNILAAIAQWGADQELEACCEWIAEWKWALGNEIIGRLRAVRRSKPPSLKEQALETLKYPKDFWSEAEVDTIRRALEALPDD